MDIIVQHTVSDYDTWKSAFDEHASERADHGCRGHRVYRDADHPNDITVFMSWDSRERANEFMQGPSLREAMQKGGVTSEPKATWLEEQETSTYEKSRAA